MEANKTKIKVCGLKHKSEVACAADYGACWYGMIFEKNSPRFISYKQAEVLLNSTPDSIEPIAVTVNPSYSKVQDLNIPVVGPPSSSQKIFKCACAVLTHFIETIANFHVLQDISTSTSEFNKVNHRVL